MSTKQTTKKLSLRNGRPAFATQPTTNNLEGWREEQVEIGVRKKHPSISIIF
jgi:hypothetical protein